VVAILVRSHRITSTEIILFCVIIPSIILHEVSHGVVALAFGDDTAKRAGRLTLNPIPHIDPVGTLIVPALMVLSTGGFFGWAKPVPVNVGRLRSPRNQGVLVSLAGPVTNLVLVAVAALVFRGFHGVNAVGVNGVALWARIVFYLGLANLLLAIFNLIPIPPLDGSVLFERLLPSAWWPGYLRIRPYTFPVLIGLVLANYALHLNLLGGLYNSLFSWWLHLVGL
jgi:Zn-dependent protease